MVKTDVDPGYQRRLLSCAGERNWARQTWPNSVGRSAPVFPPLGGNGRKTPPYHAFRVCTLGSPTA